MGKRNDLFKKKYNILDKICKAKYDMFYDEYGNRESKSAIFEFANTLEPILREKLKSILKSMKLNILKKIFSQFHLLKMIYLKC